MSRFSLIKGATSIAACSLSIAARWVARQEIIKLLSKKRVNSRSLKQTVGSHCPGKGINFCPEWRVLKVMAVTAAVFRRICIVQWWQALFHCSWSSSYRKWTSSIAEKYHKITQMLSNKQTLFTHKADLGLRGGALMRRNSPRARTQGTPFCQAELQLAKSQAKDVKVARPGHSRNGALRIEKAQPDVVARDRVPAENDVQPRAQIQQRHVDDFTFKIYIINEMIYFIWHYIV